MPDRVIVEARDALAKRVEELEVCAKITNGTLRFADDRLSALEAKLAALEASKAQPVVNVTDLHNDMAKLAQPMSLGEVAWPKGSLQWAEVEAKRMGLTRVHRKGWTYSLSIEMSMVLDVEDHLALDWEPCE